MESICRNLKFTNLFKSIFRTSGQRQLKTRLSVVFSALVLCFMLDS